MSEPDRQEQMVKDMERDLKPVFEDMISDVVALANSKLANIERRQQEALDEALSSIEELRMRIEELENQGMLRIEKLEAQVEAQAASRWTVEQKLGDELEKLRDDLEAAQGQPERPKRASIGRGSGGERVCQEGDITVATGSVKNKKKKTITT